MKYGNSEGIRTKFVFKLLPSIKFTININGINIEKNRKKSFIKYNFLYFLSTLGVDL